jgi:hypothetical protein
VIDPRALIIVTYDRFPSNCGHIRSDGIEIVGSLCYKPWRVLSQLCKRSPRTATRGGNQSNWEKPLNDFAGFPQMQTALMVPVVTTDTFPNGRWALEWSHPRQLRSGTILGQSHGDAGTHRVRPVHPIFAELFSNF